VSQVVGPVRNSGEIEAAVIKKLRWCLPFYLERAREAAGHGAIAAVKSWGVVSEYDRWPEQGLPALIVACPGALEGTIAKDGDGFYRAMFAVEVSVTFAAARGGEARLAAQIYNAAVRAALVQQSELAEKISVAAWVDEAVGDVLKENRRTITAAANVFHVEMEDIVTKLGGPDGPLDIPDPPAPDETEDWPEVTETDTEVTKA
jgi:hypothetical protein